MVQSPDFQIAKDGFKAGFAAIVGLPNAGKSTLVNALSGFPVSIISPKPQTTRDHIKAIVNGKNYQLILVDTPGFLKPFNLLERKMDRDIKKALYDDSDVVCLLIEPQPEKLAFKKDFFAGLAGKRGNLFLVINKTDLYGEKETAEAESFLKSLIPGITQTFRISALKNDKVSVLREAILKLLPFSPPYYPSGVVSDRWERFFAAEIIRESLFNLYRDEIPYSCAVEIELFREEKHGPDQIYALIYVSRKNHKPIIIGAGGKGIRKLRESSERKIEKFTGRAARLELEVKVKENWQDDPHFIKKLYGGEE